MAEIFSPLGRILALLLVALNLAVSGIVASPASAETPVQEHVTVTLVTSLGSIDIEVDLARAPVSAGDFLKYVDQGRYAGAAFYRTVRTDNDHGQPIIEVIQGGLTDLSLELPAVVHETTRQTGIRHTDGVISLARGAPGSGGGAAFFICIGDQPALDFGGMRNPDGQGFAAFGRVTSGMDVVHAIHQRPADGPADDAYVAGQILSEPVVILRATRKPGPANADSRNK